MATTIGSQHLTLLPGDGPYPANIAEAQWVDGWAVDSDTYHVAITNDEARAMLFSFDSSGTASVVGYKLLIPSPNLSSTRSNVTRQFLPYPENNNKLVYIESWDDGVSVNNYQVTCMAAIYDTVDGEETQAGQGYNSVSSKAVTNLTSVYEGGVPFGAYTTGRHRTSARTVRIDRAAYLTVLASSNDSGDSYDAGYTNFWAVRWEIDETTLEIYPTVSTSTTVVAREFEDHAFSYGIKVGDNYHWYIYDDSNNPVEVSVDPWTCDVTVDESPTLSTNFTCEQAFDALVPGTYTLSDWLDQDSDMDRGNYNDIACARFFQSKLVKTAQDLTGGAGYKSELFNSSGEDTASEEAFSGDTGTTRVFAPIPSNGWPYGHDNYREFGRATFITSRHGYGTYAHPYVFNPTEVTAPPGSGCGDGPGGAGYVIAQGSGVNTWALYDPSCNLIKSGGVGPTGLMTFKRIGRLIYIYSGGAYLGGYLIPQATWDALSIADQNYVGYYTAGDRNYQPTSSQVTQITLPGDAVYNAGKYETYVGSDHRLWSNYAKQWHYLDVVYDGSTYSSGTDFTQDTLDAATTVWRGGRSGQPTMTYAQALAAAVAANSADVIEVTYE